MSIVFKCKMCGGDLDIKDGENITQCPYCGSYQTIPNTEILETGNEKSKVSSLLKRAFIFLEDGDFDKADDYCEKVLDIEPENALAYLGKLMVEQRVRKREELADGRRYLTSVKNSENTFETSSNFQKIIRFGDKKLVSEIDGYLNNLKEYIDTELKRLDEIEVRKKEHDDKMKKYRAKRANIFIIIGIIISCCVAFIFGNPIVMLILGCGTFLLYTAFVGLLINLYDELSEGKNKKT